MTEELNQKISRLLDDDLSCEDALELLIKLQGQSELQRKMSRYEAMSHVLKSADYIPVQTGFAERISAEIKKEPALLVARRSPLARPYWALPALAASVVIVAVLMSQGREQITRSTGSGLLMVQTTDTLTAFKQKKVAPSISHDQNAQSYQVASRLTEYLQAHNSSRYIDGTVSLQPYAQVVSYSQE